MKYRTVLLLFTALAWAVPYDDLHAATLSCRGGIISDGDSRVDLVAKCGEPDAGESHNEEVFEWLHDGTKRKLFITVEDLTYNFGPNQLQRIVTLKNGIIANIRTGNYGYSKDEKPAQRDCSEQIVSRGDSKSDVVAKCGEPGWKDSHEEAFSEKLDPGVVRKRSITVDTWTYNLGPNRFVRILTFRNGRLTDIRTGNYGY